MNWIEWYFTGIVTGIGSLGVFCAASTYYVVTHMDKYGPRVMRSMMKRRRQ